MIYLDNAATSFPKPPEVIRTVCEHMQRLGGSAGRSGRTMALEVDRAVYEARGRLARLIGVRDAARLVFTFNATDALNMALKGYLVPGDHCIVSSLEHHAVVRPLRRLEGEGVTVSRLPYRPGVGADPADLAALIQPNTRLLAVIHASNVTGEILPIRELCAAARERGLRTLVDASQTAGCVPLDAETDGIDLLALTGHKALLGPQGTGALYVAPGVELRPLREGGTGSQSSQSEQPSLLPDRLESGTLNGPGIAGLGIAAEWLLNRGVETVRVEEIRRTQRLLGGLADMAGVIVYGPADAHQRVGVVSINFGETDPATAALRLEDEFGVITRAGLHCAPWAHACLGTLGQGTVRLSLSPFTTEAEVDAALEAVAAVAAELVRYE